MRHPFWTWTGWLTLGLAGCIHGFDGRKTSTHAVSEHSTSTPIVVGPFRKSAPQFAPAESKSTTRGVDPARARDLKRPQLAPPVDVSNSVSKSPTNKTLPVRRDSQVAPAQFQQPQTPVAEPALFPTAISSQPLTTTHRAIPAAKSLAANASPEPNPFAEFDRAIPLASKTSGAPVTPVDNREPILAPPAEGEVESVTDKPEVADAESSEPNLEALPMIVPAQQFPTKSTAPHELPPQVTGLFQERPSVAETSKPTARPRDVALLVEQVFEDLRQRRLDEARERTEWLKRLVAKGANPTRTTTDTAAETGDSQVVPQTSPEPQRLQVNDGAALSRESNSSSDTDHAVSSADAVPLNK